MHRAAQILEQCNVQPTQLDCIPRKKLVALHCRLRLPIPLTIAVKRLFETFVAVFPFVIIIIAGDKEGARSVRP